MYCTSCEVRIEFICYVEKSRPSLWSSGQNSWLHIRRSGFDSRPYKISWEAVGLKRGPLSLVNTTEELLERTSSGSGLEDREYGCRDPSCWSRGTLYPQELALTSPTSGGRSVCIVRSRTQATEVSLVLPIMVWIINCTVLSLWPTKSESVSMSDNVYCMGTVLVPYRFHQIRKLCFAETRQQ
jgi:hypothetical protein